MHKCMSPHGDFDHMGKNIYLKKLIDSEEKVKNHTSLLQREKMNELGIKFEYY